MRLRFWSREPRAFTRREVDLLLAQRGSGFADAMTTRVVIVQSACHAGRGHRAFSRYRQAAGLTDRELLDVLGNRLRLRLDGLSESRADDLTRELHRDPVPLIESLGEREP
jgi:hypothetical protein